jgi:hypothetical protein|eukprot:COSAG02_NODE_3157_length_7260_cov_20.933808_7_plen_243_part_00
MILAASLVLTESRIAAQYAPYDLYSLDNIGRAVHMFPHMTGMAKLDQASRLYWGPRISGAGIQNILWADPRTVEDVEECVKAMRYEGPESKYPGLHGVGMRRDVGFVLEGASLAALEGGDDGVCAIMIEKRQAVEDLQSLLSVPGVDMVQFGPSDYAMSMGVTGQGPNHPKVKEGELKTVRLRLLPPRAAPRPLADRRHCHLSTHRSRQLSEWVSSRAWRCLSRTRKPLLSTKILVRDQLGC